MPDNLLTVKQARSVLQNRYGIDINQRSIVRWCKVGTVTASKVGKCWFIKETSLIDLLGAIAGSSKAM